jgi:hypothetical protein
LAEVLAGAESAGKTCPYCRFPLKSGIRVESCDICGTLHHTECWAEGGGCSLFGCTGKSAPADPATLARPQEQPTRVAEAPHPPPAGPRRQGRKALYAALLVAALAVAALVGVLAFDRSGHGAPAPAAKQPTEAHALSVRISRIVKPLVGPQRLVSNRLTALELTPESFAALRSAAVALDQAALRAQGEQESLGPTSLSERATKAALAQALSQQAAYASALSGLPSPTALTTAFAALVASRAGAVDAAFNHSLPSAAGKPCCPKMPVGTAGPQHLAALAAQASAHTTTGATGPIGPSAGTLGDWPGGAGYTAILASVATESQARMIQSQATAAGLDAGVLFSSNFRSLRAGYWVVFSGTFGSQSDATARATRAKGLGYPQAYPRFVSQ